MRTASTAHGYTARSYLLIGILTLIEFLVAFNMEVKAALGVSDAAVYQWETGVYLPEAKRLPEIARLYGCTVDDLLTGNPEK